MDVIIVSGNLVKDATLSNDEQTILFTVASNTYISKDQTSTVYYQCSMRKTNVLSHLVKGQKVFVIGKLTVSETVKDGKKYINHRIGIYDLDLAGGNKVEG